MSLFLDIALAFPTVIFTAAVALMALYWSMVIIGALDIDAFGAAEGLDGALDGALDAAADGAAEGLEGALESALEGADGAAQSMHGATGLLAALGLRRVPVTIVLSIVVVLGWLFTYLGARALRGMGLEGAMFFMAGGGVATIALILATLSASLATRPLAPLFVTHTRDAQERLLGQTVEIRSTQVTERFGQAEFDDGGAGLLINVKCLATNALTKGSEALIVGYDHVTDTYEIAPYTDPLAPLAAQPSKAERPKELSNYSTVDRERDSS